jgi:HPt (histidine-containing phosphotransfer) domain-containing protein
MNGFLTKPIAPKLLQEHILKSVQKQATVLSAAPFLTASVPDTTQKTDLSYLLNLSDGDLNFVKEIIEAFLQEIPLALQQLETHVKNQEWEASGKVVHKLKPNFAMLGMQKLETKAKQIDACLKETPIDPDQLGILFAQLFVKIREVIPVLTQQKMDLEA